jgi:hypothetical protein
MEARCNRGRRNRGRLNRGRHNRGRLQLAAIVRHLPMKPRALEGKRFSAGQAKRNADHNRSDSLAGGHSEVFRRPPGSIFHALSTRGTSSRRSCDTASTVHCFFKVPARTHFPRSDALPGGGGVPKPGCTRVSDQGSIVLPHFSRKKGIFAVAIAFQGM